VQFVFKGPKAIAVLRGDSEHLAGAIAMPVLIGPGSVSASIVIGKRLSPTLACSSIIVAVAISVSILIALKVLHDHVRPSREQLVERYIEIAGRITALYVGTISVDMIMRGISQWIEKLN
jgi:small neutral amino acid transporter SnatA (MarC family)